MAYELTIQPRQLPLRLRVLKMAVTLLSRVAPQQMGRYGFKLFITPKRRPITDEQYQFLATGERFESRFQGENLVGYHWGSGPRVLLVHGWESNAGRMQHFVQPLVDRGYQVVAFDAPGHGQSSGKHLDFVQYGKAIRHVMDHVGGVHAIIAHSIGALSLGAHLADHPDLSVEKVVMIASAESPKSVLDMYVSQFGLSATTQHATYQSAAKRIGRPLEAYSDLERIGAFQNPMLIVHDRHDRIIPVRAAHKLANAVPAATLHTTQRLGHRRILKDEVTIERIVEFVDDGQSSVG